MPPPRTVHFVSVDAGSAEARAYLKRFIGKRVQVWVNPRTFEETTITGTVYAGKKDGNETLLARGLGRYVTPAAYTVSDYVDCLYRIAAREAASGV